MGASNAQGLVFQDSVFTAPVTVSDQTEYVTFRNCRFVNIEGDALTLNKSGAVISHCTFEHITGVGIVLDSSEVYMVGDTLRNISLNGVEGGTSTLVVEACFFQTVLGTALFLHSSDLLEVSNSKFTAVGDGIRYLDSPNGIISVSQSNFCNIGKNVAEYGIDAAGKAIFVDDVVGTVEIEGSTIDNCLWHGIWLRSIGNPFSPIGGTMMPDNSIGSLLMPNQFNP